MRDGFVTHLSGNGACSIHDFELAYNGGTSEDVPTAIEDGSFGMWRKRAAMNQALKAGAERGLGYGEALAVYVEEHLSCFIQRRLCVLPSLEARRTRDIPYSSRYGYNPPAPECGFRRNRQVQRDRFSNHVLQCLPARQRRFLEFRFGRHRSRGVLESAVHFEEFRLSDVPDNDRKL